MCEKPLSNIFMEITIKRAFFIHFVWYYSQPYSVAVDKASRTIRGQRATWLHGAVQEPLSGVLKMRN